MALPPTSTRALQPAATGWRKYVPTTWDEWQPRLYYITYYASTAVVQPFFTIFYKTSGYSDVQVGVLAAMRQWTSLPASFVWAAFADAFNMHRIVLLTCIVVAAGFRLSMVWAARAFGLLLAATCVSQVFTAPIAVMTDSMLMSSVKREGDYGRARAWGAAGWGIFTAVSGPLNQRFGYRAGFFFSAALAAPTFLWATGFVMVPKDQGAKAHKPAAVVDEESTTTGTSGPSACGDATAPLPTRRWSVMELGSSPSTMATELDGDRLAADSLNSQCDETKTAPRQQQQQQRRGAAAAATTAGTPAAAPVQADGGGGVVVADGGGGAVAADGGGGAVAVNGGGAKAAADGGGAVRAADGRVVAPQSLVSPPPVQKAATARDAATIFVKPTALAHLWQAMLQGYGIALYQSFLFLLLDELGLSPTFMGLTTLVDVVAEVPAFVCMSWLLERVSAGVLIHLSLLGYVLRLGLYATLGKWKYPQLVVFVQLLHGVTFAWGWGAGTIISRRLSTPATQATMQGMYQAAYLAVGQGVGSIVGGVLAKRFGLLAAFAVSSGVMAGGWVLYMAATVLIQAFQCDGCDDIAARFDVRKQAAAGVGGVG